MAALLSEKNEGHFDAEFPVFYRNKIAKGSGKYFYRSAIDSALRNNQVKAVSLMIEYIIKYQNNYTSSYLFLSNLPILLQKGIVLHELFSSNVFSFKYDYDEWPTTHTDPDTYIRPYNGSLFRLRENYKSVFPEENFLAIEDMMDEGQ
jgi:hypothetical protein